MLPIVRKSAVVFLVLAGAFLALMPAQQVFNPGTGGGGSGTVGSCAAAGNAYYAASGTTTSCDTSLLDSGSGGLTFANGSAAAPSVVFANNTTYGFYASASGSIGLGTGSVAHDSEQFTSTGVNKVISGGSFGWVASAADATGGLDTSISRSAADVLAVGSTSGTPDTSGRVKAAGYMSVGTTFTSNAGCTESALAGGATAGKFTAGATACTIVITMGNAATAPNGWACSAWDTTTTADTLKQTAFTATTVTFSGTVVINDVVIFGCMGF
jgi:hypothetical protein